MPSHPDLPKSSDPDLVDTVDNLAENYNDVRMSPKNLLTTEVRNSIGFSGQFTFNNQIFKNKSVIVEKKQTKDHSQEKSEAKAADNFASLNSSQLQFADIRSS